MKKTLLIDLSSIVWTSLLAGKDPEHGQEVMHEGKLLHVNSATYGYDNVQNHLLGVMKELDVQPHQMIFVKEGKNAKAGRQSIYPGYKADRSRHPEQYAQFNLCCDMLLKAYLGVGASAAWQDGMEGDDVLGYLAANLEGEVWIDSNDKDLAQCVGGDVHHIRRGMKDQNPFGPFDVRWIPAYIAVVGDTKDKIPGAKGFGEKSAEELLMRFGDDGLELLDGLIRTKNLKKLAEDVGEMKSLQKIIDDASGVEVSYELARLRIERVNTMKNPLQWDVGMVKPRNQCEDNMLRHWAGTSKLVHAANYDEAVHFLKKHLLSSPFFSLDIESSTPPESDEWLELQDKEEKVIDVFGSELTGLSITFGPNLQYTYYITLDHVEEQDCMNVTREQIRDMVDLIPRHKVTWVHNNSFELPVLYNTWGQDWKDDPEYHGFLRNVRDTSIAASYVDENERRGLKALSSRLLNYEQATYDDVTIKEYLVEDWDGYGNVLARWCTDVEGNVVDYVTPEGVSLEESSPKVPEGAREWVKVRLKMNQLPAREVLYYGADDAICTAALAVHFTRVMEIEDTVDTFHEVETWPAYVTALGFIQGVDFSLSEMQEMAKEDDEEYEKQWVVLRKYLMDVGFEGTVCPFFEEMTPANIKEAHLIVTGKELKTLVRTVPKIGKLITQMADEGYYGDKVDLAHTFAVIVAKEQLDNMNKLVRQYFVGEPRLDLGSPKQMKAFLYDTVGIPVQILNDMTKKEREYNPALSSAVTRFKKKRMGKPVQIDDEDMKLLRAKARTDDTAIDYALAFDADSIDDAGKGALHAVQKMKKIMTRRNLFYKNYLRIRHWKDGKIHAQVNQCAAVTRRYSMSNPNLQQLPKKGEAVRFRGFFKPHHKNAVIASIDFTGQELRLAAERSQDPNMLACYIGDQLKDIHSITAAGAMRLKWGDEKVEELKKLHGADLPHGMVKEEYEYRLFLKLRGLGKSDPVGKLADDLRKDSKNVNFAAQFGGQAAKLSETLIMRFEDAELFLKARSEMFPLVDVAAKRAGEFAEKHGYALTMMKARRHLAKSIMSDDRREISAALRQAWNMEIQGSAGEQVKLGMGRLWKSGALHRFDVRFFAPIHDELVTSVHKDHAVEFLKIKHECMTGPYADMRVPVLGSISLGPDFAHQIECGDWFIAENIQAAVNDIFNVKEAA